jgi:putative membrane protein
MLPFPSLPWFEFARFRRRRLTRAALVAVAIVPLFYGVLYVWANWDPTGNLDRVKAAVVNLDEPVTITGQNGKDQIVPLGRSLTGELTGNRSGRNFDWVLSDAADARKGLDDGEYAAVVTIPKTFSAAATSTGTDNGAQAVQAKLSVQTNDAQNYLTGTIARAVGAAAVNALNAQVSGTYLNNIYVGFSTLRGQIGDAAKGAGDLSDGAGQLSAGVTRLDAGAGQLTVGLNQLAAGTRDLPAQAAQLNSGAHLLAGGAGKLAAGASKLDSGLGQLAAGTAALPGQARQLDAGAQQLVGGAGKLAAGAGQLATGAQNVSTGALFVSTGLANYAIQARAIAAACSTSGASAAYCAQVTALANGVGPLVTGATGVEQGTDFVKAGAGQVQAGAKQLDAGATALRQGTARLAQAAPALSGGLAQAAAGAKRLDSGAYALAGGAGRLATGTAQLAGAAPQLSQGISSAATGAGQLADGTGKLAAGAKQLDSGSSRLADGLREGARQIPSYPAAQRERLSKVAATPVVADTQRINAVQTNGVGLAPYFMALALWVGAMASYMLLRALSARNLASTASSPRVALAGYLPGAVLGGVQALLLVGVLRLVVGLHAVQLPGLIAFAVLIGLTFAAVNQALIATFGGPGRFLALILVSLQLTTAGGTYPIATAPAFFSTLHGFLPMTYAVHGLRQCIAGGTDGVGQDVAVLLLWAVGALLVTVLAAHRQRTWTVSRLHATAIV